MKVKLSITIDLLPTTEDRKKIKINSRQAKKFMSILWNTLKDSGEWTRTLTDGKKEYFVAYALEKEEIKIVK